MLKCFLIAAWLCALAAAPGAAQDPPAALAGPVEAAPAAWWHDWRLLSVIAAFLGFTFGTWIKHAFDLRLDRIRRDKENTVFAIAFRAELMAFMSDAKIRLRVLKKFGEADQPVIPTDTVQLDISAKPVYANNTHRLGGFGDRVALSVVAAHGTADHVRHNVAYMLARPLGDVVRKRDLEVFRRDFRLLIEGAARAINALDAFLGVPERYPDPEALAAELDPADPAGPAAPEASTK